MGLTELSDEERDNPDLILTPAREDALEKWKADPTGWSFLSAKDPDTGEPIVRTIDQRDKKTPIKPFPVQLDYLHYLVDLLHNEPYGICEKSSQMVVTTTISLSTAIKCAIHPGYKALLSKHSEEEAEIILAEKIRDPWRLMPSWVQRQFPISKKPKNTVFFGHSSEIQSVYMGLPENAAEAKARGQTYNFGQIDEAEFQEMLRALITAMKPRCSQLWFWSTPSIGGDGVTTFREYLANDPVTLKKHPGLWAIKKKWAFVKGMDVRRNEDKDFTIVRIHYSADPSKTKEWAEVQKKGYPSRVLWEQEMEISRRSSAGQLFYPQFSENPRRYMLRMRHIPSGPVLRGYDFGGRNPACVWSYWSPKSRRFVVLRELLGIDIDTYQFRDLVKYLSGQLSLESLQQHPRAMQMLDESIKAEKDYPEPPWFEGKHRYYDFAGHEAVMTGRGLTRDGEAKTAAEIMALGDIYLTAAWTSQNSRTSIVNGLSKIYEDGWGGILFDPACKLLIEGMFNKIVYAKATATQPDPTLPAKDAVYSHLHEALGYILTNVVRLEDADMLPASYGPDGMPLPEPESDIQISSYLCEGR